MNLTILDCVAVFFLAVLGYVGGWAVFWAAQQLRRAAIRLKQEQIIAHMKANPRFPFGLPVAHTWNAAEFVCEVCGVNGYFSLVKLDPHHVPPELREQAAGQDVLDEKKGVREVRGLYRAPVVFQCRECGAMLANGDAAPLFQPGGEEGP